jgi:DNA polymerase-3 subunit gamma/tau
MNMNTDIKFDLRPERFADLHGQSGTVSLVTGWLARHELPRGILLTGEPGCGKTTIGRLVVKSIACERWVPGHVEPCCNCNHCRQFEETTYGCWGSLYLDVTKVNKRELAAEIGRATGLWGDIPLFIEDLDMMGQDMARYLSRQIDCMTSTNIIATSTKPENLDPSLTRRMRRISIPRPDVSSIWHWVYDVATKAGIAVADENAAKALCRHVGSNYGNVLSVLSVLRDRALPTAPLFRHAVFAGIRQHVVNALSYKLLHIIK